MDMDKAFEALTRPSRTANIEWEEDMWGAINESSTPTHTWPCQRCGATVERYRGSSEVTCGRCGAEYNASGQRLRDDWRGNPSTYDSEIGDMEGYEMQHSRWGSRRPPLAALASKIQVGQQDAPVLRAMASLEGPEQKVNGLTGRQIISHVLATGQMDRRTRAILTRMASSGKIKCQRNDCDKDATYRGHPGNAAKGGTPYGPSKDEQYYCDDHAPAGGVRHSEGFDESTKKASRRRVAAATNEAAQKKRATASRRKVASGRPVKAVAIYPDKTVEDVTVSGYKDGQKIVGGLIEPITLSDGSTMYCNEEYAYQFGPEDVNWIACDVAGLGGQPRFMLSQPILGPVYIVGPLDDEGYDTDVTETARRWVARVANEAGGSGYTARRRTAAAARPIHEIAAEIQADWKNVYFGAVPYLDAMTVLDSIEDYYGADDARSIVLYFLSNATTWRGEKARAIKKELKAMVDRRTSARR